MVFNVQQLTFKDLAVNRIPAVWSQLSGSARGIGDLGGDRCRLCGAFLFGFCILKCDKFSRFWEVTQTWIYLHNFPSNFLSNFLSSMKSKLLGRSLVVRNPSGVTDFASSWDHHPSSCQEVWGCEVSQCWESVSRVCRNWLLELVNR